jgi:hypothetical protein
MRTLGLYLQKINVKTNEIRKRENGNDDGQWRYSPDRALASLYGFHDSL